MSDVPQVPPAPHVPVPQDPMELTVTAPATGGRGIARTDGGQVVFVSGALPGETVTASITADNGRFLEAVSTSVLQPARQRRPPPCPLVAAGCGGCDLSHAEPALQRELKRAIVEDCLRRIARIDEFPAISDGPNLVTAGFRTTLRAAVDASGRAGIRAHRSHDPVIGPSCRVAHPLAEELLVDSRYPGASEVTIRVGARTGDRLVVVDEGAARVTVPDGVGVVLAASPGDAAIHEVIDGVRLRISAGSFFQTRPDGAEALVEAVRSGLGGPGGVDRLVDLCAGVGLFAATVPASSVVAVESSASSAADAMHNLASKTGASVQRTRFEDWRPSVADAVIADPARAGLGRVGVAKVVSCAAPVVALVSCDPAAMARDIGLLVAAGYGMERITIVDLFPDTHHIEAVTILRR